jgi:hypothetical protein
MKLIKTFDGSMAPKDKCRRILKEYYEENKQCFFMPDGKWHRINNGKIFFNHETKEYVLGNKNMVYGIVGFEKDFLFKYGYFTPNVAKNIHIHDGNKKLPCLSRDIAKNLDYKEVIGDGVFYSNQNIYSSENKYHIYKTYSKRMDYRCGYRLKETTDAFNKYFIGDELKHQFYKYLPEVTFGIEYETENGRLPEDLMLQNGLIPVRDGSLRKNGYEPFEYATIIHDGKVGLQAVKKQCDLLQKYCVTGLNCSTHIHIGNKNITKNYISSMYILGVELQEEIYSMFPKYYRNTSKFKGTGTDYCNPLNKLKLTKESESNFDIISKEICNYDGWNFKTFGMEHPSDPENRSKWNIPSRYKWQNLIPTIFGKSGTVEFRIHGPTFNHDKIINWLYIISAIVKFAEKYKNEISSNPELISNINLKRIILDVYEDSNVLSNYLLEYVEYRKSLMKEHSKMGDCIGKIDLKEDNILNFKSNIKSLVL